MQLFPDVAVKKSNRFNASYMFNMTINSKPNVFMCVSTAQYMRTLCVNGRLFEIQLQNNMGFHFVLSIIHSLYVTYVAYV